MRRSSGTGARSIDDAGTAAPDLPPPVPEQPDAQAADQEAIPVRAERPGRVPAAAGETPPAEARETAAGEPPAVRITPRGLGRARGGHPWIYRGDIAELPAGLVGGEVVRVVGPRSEFAGLALYSSASLIALRIFHRRPAVPDDAFWAARIEAALELRRQLFPGASAYRLIYGESDGLPSLIADRYADYVVVQTLSQGAERLRDGWVATLVERLAPAGVIARNDVRVRGLEGLPPQVEILHGRIPDSVEIELNGLRMLVDLRAGQKTGAFLDQRENYLAAAALARGRVLDAFSFQGAFALHAAQAAERVDAIEISAAALRRGEENARLNGIDRIRFVEANAFDYLHAMDLQGERFETVILDPPAFAKSRRALESGLRGYKEINLRAMRILSPGGILVTCSCSYHVTEPMFLEMLGSAALDAGRSCQLLERRGQSRDHPVLITCPETAYLKCVVARIV